MHAIMWINLENNMLWNKPDKTITYCMILLDEIPRIGKHIERTQMIARGIGR